MSSRYPGFWGWLYRTFNKRENQGFASWLSQGAISKRFIPFVRSYKPDFIVSTHPLPAMLISRSKEQDIIDILSSIVVTDFGCHSFWIDSETNYYFVATDAVAMCLQNYRVKRDQIIVTGIPIESKFSESVNKATLLKKLGLKTNVFTVLIVGGQLSFEVLQEIITKSFAKNTKIQFLVVAGRDKLFKEQLDTWEQSQPDKIKTFGFVDNMHEMMSVADVIFTKAGGLTTSECLAKGLPMIINKVIPGQEEDNVTYLAAQGAAVRATNADEIFRVILELSTDSEKHAKMQTACAELGRPQSAKSLAEFVVQSTSK